MVTRLPMSGTSAGTAEARTATVVRLAGRAVLQDAREVEDFMRRAILLLFLSGKGFHQVDYVSE